MLIEQIDTKAAAFDRLQELLGDDKVGINISSIQWHGQAGMYIKCFHIMLLNAVSLTFAQVAVLLIYSGARRIQKDVTDIYKMPVDGGSSGHRRADQVCTTTKALTTFKVTV